MIRKNERIIVIGFVLLALAIFGLIRNCSPGINVSKPSSLDVAKIIQLLGIKKYSYFTVEQFQLVYVGGFHDTHGTCAFKVKLSPEDAENALKTWVVSNDLDEITIRFNLIDWHNTRGLFPKGLSFYTTTTQCSRTLQQGEKWSAWTDEQQCIAFWDTETTNTLIVNTEGDMFLRDAVFK